VRALRGDPGSGPRLIPSTPTTRLRSGGRCLLACRTPFAAKCWTISTTCSSRTRVASRANVVPKSDRSGQSEALSSGAYGAQSCQEFTRREDILRCQHQSGVYHSAWGSPFTGTSIRSIPRVFFFFYLRIHLQPSTATCLLQSRAGCRWAGGEGGKLQLC